MVISLLVLLLPVAVVVALYRLRGGEDAVVVDPSAAIAQARQASAFPVVSPDGLPEDWQAVSADFTNGEAGATLRIGYVTPSGGAVQLIESDESFGPLTDRELGDQIRTVGTVTFDGREWSVVDARRDERALVSAAADYTLIVIGRAPEAELRTLAAAVS